MRLPRVQFTVRTMTVVVAVMAMVLFVVIDIVWLSRVARLRRQKAEEFATMERIFGDDIRRLERDLAWSRQEMESPVEDYKNMRGIAAERYRGIKHLISKYERIVAYAETLKGKYARAASRPWASVTPDPPRPPQ
jgi:hypothetical protein